MSRPYYSYGKYLLGREAYTSVVNTPDGYRRYFSSIDTDVYFGEERIDEMVAFNFSYAEEKLPIYGYNNFRAKRIITGRKTIQGTFATNFIGPYYILEKLSKTEGTLYSSNYDDITYCSEDDKDLFNKPFDIIISYGEAKDQGSFNSSIQILTGCRITSYQQAFDTSGEPILDMYSFIAQDLIIEAISPTAAIDETFETISYNDDDLSAGPGNIIYHADKSDDKAIKELENYCNVYKDTVGLITDSVINFVNGKYTLNVNVTSYDNRGVELSKEMIMTINYPERLPIKNESIELTRAENSSTYTGSIVGNIDCINNIYKQLQGQLSSYPATIEMNVTNLLKGTSTGMHSYNTSFRLGTGNTRNNII